MACVAFLAEEAKPIVIAIVVAQLRTTTTDEVSEVLKTTIRLANKSFIGLHQGAVVVELVKLILEGMKISAEGEISLHEDAVVDVSDRLAIVYGGRWRKDL